METDMKRTRSEELDDVPHRANTDRFYGKHLRSISTEELGNLSVDNGGHLYWEGRPLEFAKPLKYLDDQIARTKE